MTEPGYFLFKIKSYAIRKRSSLSLKITAFITQLCQTVESHSLMQLYRVNLRYAEASSLAM